MLENKCRIDRLSKFRDSGCLCTHQGFPVLPDEVLSWCGPARQQNICHLVLRYLQMPQVETYKKIMHQVLTLNKYFYVNSLITKTFISDTKQSQLICIQTVNLPQCTVHVLQEFWEVEELWDELFDVGWTLHASLPGCCHWVELPVCAVKPIQQHAPMCHRRVSTWNLVKSCTAQRPHLPLCSWICRVVNGSMRIM